MYAENIGDKYDNKVEDWLLQRGTLMNSLNQIKLHIEFPAISGLQVGHMVEIIVPAATKVLKNADGSIRNPDDLRDDILDAVDGFVLDSGFSDLPVESVKYNYMTKIIPEVYGYYPEQVLIIYTMISSREYGHEEENGFLDGLYKVLSDINGVTLACGETAGGTT